MDYTLEDEKRSLERFLIKENIQVTHNYLRMIRGSKPLFNKISSFAYNWRSVLFDGYDYLVFMNEYLLWLQKNKEDIFTENLMMKLYNENIEDFSFERIYGAYCISFKHLNEDYYFYLGDSIASRFPVKLFNIKVEPYSYTNLPFLEENDFKGLSEK